MANTGRTTFKHVQFNISDTGNVLRSIPISGLSVCGVTYNETTDVIAWQDAVNSALPTMPDAPIEWSGPFDNSAASTAGVLSGSHTVLSGLNGGYTPRSIDVQIGIRAAWSSGEPQFGITASATSGYLVTKYNVDLSSMMYSARAVLYPGSALPAWGVAAETSS